MRTMLVSHLYEPVLASLLAAAPESYWPYATFIILLLAWKQHFQIRELLQRCDELEDAPGASHIVHAIVHLGKGAPNL